MHIIILSSGQIEVPHFTIVLYLEKLNNFIKLYQRVPI